MDNYTPNNRPLPFPAGALSVLICAAFGANAVAVKISLFGLGAFTTAGLRFSIASVAILLWAKTTHQAFRINKRQAYQLLLLSVIFTVQLSLLHLGLSKTNASRGTLLINFQPFFVLLLAHCFIPDDMITKRKVLGILIGFAGVMLVFMEKKGVSADFVIGDLMIIAAAFIWACSAIYVKRIIASFKPLHIVLYPMIFSVPVFFLEALLWDKTMIAYLDSKILVSLMYQGLVTAAFCFMAWNNMLKKYGAVALHSFIFLTPVAGVLFGGLLLDEPVTTKILMSLLLIMSGIFFVNFKPENNSGRD